MIYYISDTTHSTDCPKEGIVWLANQDEQAKKAVVFGNQTIFEGIFKSLGFTDEVIKGIEKGRNLVVSGNMSIPVVFLSEDPVEQYDYVLIFYPNTKVLNKVVDETKAKDTLVIPWTAEDVQYLSTIGTAYEGSF